MHLKIDKTWTLFLDRDGVINERLVDDYVKTPDQFSFIKGSIEAITLFSNLFSRILVVTNQQGIGKNLMTIDDLDLIHSKLINTVEQAGGKIDKVYVSPYLETQNHFTRKPSVGMAILAKKDFREISFRKSIMAGDSISDMVFGKRLGMKTVFIGPFKNTKQNARLIDLCFPDLYTFANQLKLNNSQ